MPKQILLDTDIGYDPDDILALAYLLSSEQLELIGCITSDEVEQQRRAVLLRDLLDACGHVNVPVFSGVDLGLSNLLIQSRDPDAPISGDIHGVSFRDFLEKVCDRKIHYLSIGPLSNLAMITREYPCIVAQWDVLLMGGSFGTQEKAEHNFRLDSVSAQYVLNNLNNLSIMPADISTTDTFALDTNHRVYRYFASRTDPFSQFVHTNLRLFYEQKYPVSYMHDPIALMLVTESIAEWEKRALSVSTDGFFESSADSREHSVCTHVHEDEFWKRYLAQVCH